MRRKENRGTFAEQVSRAARRAETLCLTFIDLACPARDRAVAGELAVRSSRSFLHLTRASVADLRAEALNALNSRLFSDVQTKFESPLLGVIFGSS
jgi:hypothetical protein